MGVRERLIQVIRPWARRKTNGYVRGVISSDDRHLRLAEAFTECAGQWVAVTRNSGKVIAARPTPYELSAYLKEHGIRGVDMLRAPAVGEPEVVGFG